MLPTGEDAPQAPPRRQKPSFRIKYTQVVHVSYWIFTAWFVIDRLFINVFPRQNFKIENGFSLVTMGFTGYSTSSDRIDGFLGDGGAGGPWNLSALLFDIIARVSGRVSIAATSLAFFTMMKTFHHWLKDQAPMWLDVDNLEEDLVGMHKSAGWQIVFATIPHIMFVFVPLIFNGFDLVIQPGKFDIIGTERQSYKTVNIIDEVVTLGIDDIWRLIEMPVILLLLLPFSYYLFRTKWGLGIDLHVIVAVMYFYDIVRRHSHPHSWIFNGPVFFFWMIDIFAGRRWKRQGVTGSVVCLNDQYCILLVDNPGVPEDVMAPVWQFRMPDHVRRHRAHPYIGAQIRSKVLSGLGDLEPPTSDTHAFKIVSKGGQLELEQGKKRAQAPHQESAAFNWIFFVQISPREGAFTKCLHGDYKEVPAKLDSFGPYRSPYQAVADMMVYNDTPLLLCASGSGAGMIIDALDFSLALLKSGQKREKVVRLVYTCNDLRLFQFITDLICRMLDESEAHLKKFDGKFAVKVALTGNKEVQPGFVPIGAEHADVLQVVVGRLDFHEEICNCYAGTQVYFCGAPLLGEIIAEDCRYFRLDFSMGHVFGGPSKEQLENNLREAFQIGEIDHEEFTYELDQHVVKKKTSRASKRTAPRKVRPGDLEMMDTSSSQQPAGPPMGGSGAIPMLSVPNRGSRAQPAGPPVGGSGALPTLSVPGQPGLSKDRATSGGVGQPMVSQSSSRYYDF